MLRIAFYYNHYNTLGHSMRVFSLVKGFKEYFKNEIDILILQSGTDQNVFPFTDYAKVYQLPYSIDKRGLFIEEATKVYEKMISSGKMDNMVKERLYLVKKLLNEFKPNVFITEYFPLGQEFWTFEVPCMLRYVKDSFDCKIFASCGYLNYIDKAYDYINEFYDFLFIHSPKEFAEDYHLYLHKNGSLQLKKILKDFSDKIYFTGFVLEKTEAGDPKAIRKKYLGNGQDRLIVVSRGGGIFNKKIILAPILAAKRNKKLFFVVSCGPATAEKEFKEYKHLAKGIENLELNNVIPPAQFNSYLKAADLCVNMSGYNTTVRLLYYGKKSILIPFHMAEQKWRASLVKKYLPSRTIDEDDLNVSILEKNISELIADKGDSRVNCNEWFLGIENTIRKLKCLV